MDLSNILGNLDGADLGRAAALITKLPDYFDKLADGLNGAGEQAKLAAVALAGPDGKSGIQDTLADSAKALAGLVASVNAGAAKLADAAESAAKVPLMDGPASRLSDAASEMSSATARMTELAQGMEQIGAVLATVAAALAKLGDNLDDSGAQARGFAQLG